MSNHSVDFSKLHRKTLHYLLHKLGLAEKAWDKKIRREEERLAYWEGYRPDDDYTIRQRKYTKRGQRIETELRSVIKEVLGTLATDIPDND